MLKIVAFALRRNWKWPLVFSLFCGGSAAGLFLHLFWNYIVLKNPSMDWRTTVVFLLPSFLAAAGFSALAPVVGRFSNDIGPVHYLSRSGRLREFVLLFMFIILSVCYAMSGTLSWAYGAAFSAIIFMLNQGVALSRGIAANDLNAKLIPAVFVTSGICSGYGLWLFLRVCPQFMQGALWITWGGTAIFLNLLTWGVYCWLQWHGSNNVIPKVLPVSARLFMLSVLLDGAIPLVMLIGIYASGLAAETAKSWVLRLGGGCGISLCLGGWLKIYQLIQQISLNTGVKY